MAELTPEEIKRVIHDFVNTLSSQQYKGARYVPIIGRLGEESAEWDNTAPYEPLTIVLHEGNSYTSRKYVPAGIGLDNGEYWALTGQFNGQIAQLRALVQRYQAEIDANAQAIHDEVQARQDACDELADNIAANAESISGLSENLSAEVEARQEADGELSGQISTVSGNLSDEVEARRLADQQLKQNIDDNQTLTDLQFIAVQSRIGQNGESIVDLQALTSNFLIGSTVTPAYQGSFMSDEQNAAVLFIDPYVYCFSVNNYDNTGTVRVFSRVSNALYATYTNVQLGHGNSVAYDGEHIYVLPLNTYTNGASARSNKLYVFDTNMSDRREWTLPTYYPYGVSYDFVNHKLYYVDAQNNDPTIKLYVYDADQQTWSNVFSLSNAQFPSVAGSDVYWQDFAVRDDVLIAVKLDGTSYTIKFDASDNTAKIAGTFRIAANSAGGMWKMGEIEGVEFDTEGRLWNMRTFNCGFRNANKNYNQSIGFVTTLNTKEYAEIDEGVQFQPYGTLDLVSPSKFKLGRYDIHSVNECMCRLDDYAVVRVNKGDTYSDTRIRTMRDLVVRVEGTMNISDLIEVDAGIMFLYVTQDDDTLEKGVVNFTGTSGACIETNSRAIAIYFRNRGTVNIDEDKERFINTGYSPTLISIGGLGNLTDVLVNQNTHVTAMGLLMGSYKVYGGGA